MKHIELEIPIEDMDEADLRKTFSEVMEAHEENVKEYAELEAKVEEAEKFSEQVEALESELTEAKAYFAEKGEAVTGIDSDVLVERFEMSELAEFAAKYDENSVEAAEPEAPEEGEFSEEEVEEEPEKSIFADRPSKAPDLSSAVDSRKEAAKQRLSGLGGISLDD